MVAVGTSSANKKVAESLLSMSAQMESLAPQLVNAGRIRMVYPENKAAEEHFQNLHLQLSEVWQRLRALCDDSTDGLSFVCHSSAAMRRRADDCRAAMAGADAVRMVEGSAALARLAGRVAQVARQEADNTEDAEYAGQLTSAADKLQHGEERERGGSNTSSILIYFCTFLFSHCTHGGVRESSGYGHGQRGQCQEVGGGQPAGEMGRQRQL